MGIGLANGMEVMTLLDIGPVVLGCIIGKTFLDIGQVHYMEVMASGVVLQVAVIYMEVVPCIHSLYMTG